MCPKKPEDYEPAIQQDREYLKKEAERMISGNISIDIGEQPEWMKKALAQPKEKPTVVKCTCPLKLSTKKRNKKKGMITISRVTNGYTNKCPVHTRL